IFSIPTLHMNEQVLIYEVKSAASSNANLLFSGDRQYFYWNDRAFRKLKTGDYVFVINRHAPFVLFCRLEATDIPTTISTDTTQIVDGDEQFSVAGQWEGFVRLRIHEEIIPPSNWEWKTL